MPGFSERIGTAFAMTELETVAGGFTKPLVGFLEPVLKGGGRGV